MAKSSGFLGDGVHLEGPFELDRVGVRLSPDSTGHAHAGLIERLVARLGHIERAARLMQEIGVRVLIEHVRRDGMRRRPRTLGERRQGKGLTLPVDLDHA